MTSLAGILLPSSVLDSGWFQALAAFVAVNTLIYAALSLAKLIPRKAPSPPPHTLGVASGFRPSGRR